MTGTDPAMATALDRLTPPPLSGDFADRVMMALESENLPALPPPPRSSARGNWLRPRNLMLGLAGFSLMSAAAAATGVLGSRLQNLPVISVIAEQIDAKPKPAPSARAKPAPVKKAKAPAQKPLATPTLPEPEQVPLDLAEQRREAVAKRIADRIARRDALRAEHGLPPRPRRLPPAARERFKQLPPEERRALIERVREIRRGQIAQDPQAWENRRADRRDRIRAKLDRRRLELETDATPSATIQP